jgi:hypothetical protein
MIDLVSANEFAFSPSAFLAAYIEQDTASTTTEVTANSGDVTTTPVNIGSLSGNVAPRLEFETLSGSGYVGRGPESGFPVDGGTENTIAVGQTENYLRVTGSVSDVVGQTVEDTRSITKTTSTGTGATNTVVLVLSYGSYRGKCANAQATVTKIYQEVANYLNSL